MTPARLSRFDCELPPWKCHAPFGAGWKMLTFQKNETIFTQGKAADAVFYIEEGNVRYSIVSRFGKEVTLGILREGEFFGDGGLAGQTSRMGSGTAVTNCRLLQIDNESMILALHTERALRERFIACLLVRNIRYHKELVYQLFDSSEMRLARVLLLLADFGNEGAPEPVIPKVSQETLAGMAGTTVLQIRSFLKEFKKSGFIAYSRKTGSEFTLHFSMSYSKTNCPAPIVQAMHLTAMRSGLLFASLFRLLLVRACTLAVK